MPTEPAASAKRRKLEEQVDKNVAVLDRDRSLPEQPASTIENQKVRNALQRNRQYGDLPLAVITPDPDQVRRVDTSSEAFDELVASVREHGVLEPITVRWLEAKQQFQIITGERRFQAARLVKLETIPAIVRDVTDTDMAIHQLVENLQRENMNPIEEAKAFRRYIAATGQNQDQLAKRIGKSKTYVSQIIGILDKLNRQEQDVLAEVSGPKLPGKSLLFEAIRIPDPAIRLGILRGEIKWAQAREAAQNVPREKRDGRTKYTTHRYELPELQAKVTVTIQRAGATDQDMRGALEAALKELSKRGGKSGGLRRLVGKG